ncbi:MAG: YicC family protein [bacterium]|nr:YicC family protein [bacterium]
MESMTGYAFVEKSTEQFSFSIEIKTLNSRYLETYINLPRLLRNEENALNSIMKERFSRGKVTLTIDIFDWNDTKPVSLNRELIVKYYRELQTIHKSLKIKEPLDFESVLRLDGITQRERSAISTKSLKDIYGTLDEVIKKAIDMRKKEGAATRKDITNSLTEITKSVGLIKKLSKDVVNEKKENLKRRLESLLGDSIDDVRLYSELAILADKLDINEEIVRLNDHLKKFKSVLKDAEQIGKKIDFLAQEMFREVNTIASKSNNTEIAHITVDIKNHIDKIREQGRNVV